jgi:phenylacetate-CoA ligase
VHPLTLISTLYGQGRGYHRLDIRRRVFANEKLSPEALSRFNEKEFQHHVHRSLGRFPYYAERVKAYRGSLPKPGERVRSAELPVWTRELQSEFFAQQERPADATYMRQTSGSTSVPVRYYATRESYEWRTCVMDRAYTWAHAQEGIRSVHVWGADPYPQAGFHRVKRRVHLALQRRHYYDAFQEFGDDEMAACCELINRIRPTAIVGYTGMLVDIARFAREKNALSWKSRSMVTTAEQLMPGQRELLEDVMTREVFNSYGAREVMNIASECEAHQGMHLSWDNLRTEVVDDDGVPVPPGQSGRVVVTDFHNAAAPLIRYEVGDIGSMAPDEPCACGRPFPRIARIEGRMQDVIQSPHGPMSQIWFGLVIRDFAWINGWQAVQDRADRVVIRIVAGSDLTPELTAPLLAKLRSRLGDMQIDLERVDALSRRASGKHQPIISTVERAGRPAPPSASSRHIY